MSGTVLVLGASGRFGRACADAFWNAGWRVRSFDRATGELMRDAQGAEVIVNGWNPAYPDWAAQVPKLTAQVLAAAKASGATVLLPGNLYVYGAGAPELLGPDTPHRATNPLGRIRIAMESAYRESGVQTIVLRSGDFIDTEPSGNWLDRVIVKPLKHGRIVYPGLLDAPHAWAYLPDTARAAVMLAARRESLAGFEDIPFPGYTLTGRDLAAALSLTLGRQVRATRMRWLPVHVLRPVWPLARSLAEMRYLWSMPHAVDPARFDALLPAFRATPLDEALRRAIQHQVDPDQMVAQRAGAPEAAV